MDYERLRVFVEIVDAGSMTAAARALHLTQPALSRSVKLLEEDLGVPLFERRPRRLVLTGSRPSPAARARRSCPPSRRWCWRLLPFMLTEGGAARRMADTLYAALRR
jgi:hypothetical protein